MVRINCYNDFTLSGLVLRLGLIAIVNSPFQGLYYGWEVLGLNAIIMVPFQGLFHCFGLIAMVISPFQGCIEKKWLGYHISLCGNKKAPLIQRGFFVL